jgi:hypothetical protein
MASKDLIPWTTRAARSASYREMNRMFGDVFLAPFGSVRAMDYLGLAPDRHRTFINL